MITHSLCGALAVLVLAVLPWPAGGHGPVRRADSPLPAAHDAAIDVSGTWLSDQTRVRSSSCPEELTDAVRDDIRAGNLSCTFIIGQAESVARVVEICPDGAIERMAQVDAWGELRYSESLRGAANGCRWWSFNTFSADLSRSPTTISSTYRFRFDASCRIGNCAIELAGRLQRLELARSESAPPVGAAVGCGAMSASRGHRD